MKKSGKDVIAGGEVSPTATPIAYSEVERLIVSVRGQPDLGTVETLGTMGTLETMGTLGADR